MKKRVIEDAVAMCRPRVFRGEESLTGYYTFDHSDVSPVIGELLDEHLAGTVTAYKAKTPYNDRTIG